MNWKMTAVVAGAGTLVLAMWAWSAGQDRGADDAPPDLDALADALMHGNESQRIAAASGLLEAAGRDAAGVRDHPACMAALVVGLADGSGGVRIKAISAINRATGVHFPYVAEADAYRRRQQIAAIESFLRQRGLL
jgi:hypothetical protein